MPDHQEKDRFNVLMGSFLDQSITEEQLQELTILVKGDSDFSKEFRSQLLMDNWLSQYDNESHSAQAFVRAVEASLDAVEDADAFVDKVAQMAGVDDGGRVSRMPWLVSSASLTACVVFGLLLLTDQAAGVGDGAAGQSAFVADVEPVTDRGGIVLALVG